jgi:hypothetical protein
LAFAPRTSQQQQDFFTGIFARRKTTTL